ncbi:glutamate synthase large subunit [Spirochaeta cellobiosiphila]|uniref:glutamate synthase large subunit n=1 Tax=Spirochaeta cellobiosiphila TaxID=504483 RepID=UPI0003FAA893|nr:glutamate synthase large subunit [Spirochaeta cellobiosiphila]
MALKRRPEQQGLYLPEFEKDSCGVGFVAHIKGQRSHQIVADANTIAINMTHRGAVGSEKNTGDGAGILTALPYDFLEAKAKADIDVTLPERGAYAAGIVFLPTEKDNLEKVKSKFEEIAKKYDLDVLGWRLVPTDNSMIGPSALESEPAIYQVFVSSKDGLKEDALERQLFVLRKVAARSIRGLENDPHHFFYICSLSTKVLVYKGMFTPEQVFSYYPDLEDPLFTSHLALVHSRFSTNTFPSWDRAQPLRYMAHNGEINTLKGNANKMKSREGMLASDLLGSYIEDIKPVHEPDLSDSGYFDNVLELLLLSGRTLPEAVMMMIPEAWQNHQEMSEEKKAFYQYHSALMEPWDGPASIAFTDGHFIGATLDRNGLRPSRFYITHDDIVIMASEVGVLDVAPDRVKQKGRLQPGRMFLVDFEEGRIIADEEIKDKVSKARPYQAWLDAQKIELSDLPCDKTAIPEFENSNLKAQLKTFGYTTETIKTILHPTIVNNKEPLGSMGNDAPLAVLSDKPRMLYDYFKQLFAQVTNPPIDSIREEIIMSLECFIGPELNLLESTEAHAHRLRIPHPLLTNQQLASLKQMDYRGWKTKIVDITYSAQSGEKGLLEALDRICKESDAAIGDGYSLVILSDRNSGKDSIPLSSLLAVGTVHHYLVKKSNRNQIGLVIESGEAREVHHFCMLSGYGADAVNPYLAYEAMFQMNRDHLFDETLTEEDLVYRYSKAIAKGMRKVFGKMGISTLDSYKGAQIFEAVGLNSDVIARSFVGTPSRIKGAGFDIIAQEAERRHALAYPDRNPVIGYEDLNPGDFQWRHDEEKHMWDAESIASLQQAVRQNDSKAWERFRDRQNQRSHQQATLRGLLKFKKDPSQSIPLDEVEPATEIVKRFATGAMSFGSISKEAHEALAVAMNRLGGKSNTGEGGEDPKRFKPLDNGDSKRSAIKQVASGRFGVTIEYLNNADEIQIKMAQGAKPGEGGELPGHKVNDVIAQTRHSTPGVGLISPPPHHDIYSIEDLAQLIFDLKNANPKARISVKLVSEVGVGTIAAGVAKGHADHILVSGHDGGTGAAALTGIKNAGLPWELGIAETHQTLVMNDLRSRVVLQTDGQCKTGRDVVIASILGAEEVGFATIALISLGCIMMRKCQLNTCPVGVATQNKDLRALFKGKPEHVTNLFTFIAEDVRSLMAELGVKSMRELIGRVDLLEADEAVRNWKSGGVDLSPLLSEPIKNAPNVGHFCCISQDHGLEDVLDRTLIKKSQKAIDQGESVEWEEQIVNINRSVGTMLSSVIAQKYGMSGLKDSTIKGNFNGSAGQSFGAWLSHGVTFRLEGDANDYVGKGLSGGRLAIYPPKESTFAAEDNVIIGNVAFYGAVEGEAFIRGQAAERFCVRNSGAKVVVEGVGDHGCEYMTGGVAVILGKTGRNFGAGMSGGVAFVLDTDNQLDHHCNKEMIGLEEPDSEDFILLKQLISDHFKYTNSSLADDILANWEFRKKDFVKVMPMEYKKVLMASRQKEVVNG